MASQPLTAPSSLTHTPPHPFSCLLPSSPPPQTHTPSQAPARLPCVTAPMAWPATPPLPSTPAWCLLWSPRCCWTVTRTLTGEGRACVCVWGGGLTNSGGVGWLWLCREEQGSRKGAAGASSVSVMGWRQDTGKWWWWVAWGVGANPGVWPVCSCLCALSPCRKSCTRWCMPSDGSHHSVQLLSKDSNGTLV